MFPRLPHRSNRQPSQQLPLPQILHLHIHQIPQPLQIKTPVPSRSHQDIPPYPSSSNRIVNRQLQRPMQSHHLLLKVVGARVIRIRPRNAVRKPPSGRLQKKKRVSQQTSHHTRTKSHPSENESYVINVPSGNEYLHKKINTPLQKKPQTDAQPNDPSQPYTSPKQPTTKGARKNIHLTDAGALLVPRTSASVASAITSLLALESHSGANTNYCVCFTSTTPIASHPKERKEEETLFGCIQQAISKSHPQSRDLILIRLLHLPYISSECHGVI